jgi:hypothetical protein
MVPNSAGAKMTWRTRASSSEKTVAGRSEEQLKERGREDKALTDDCILEID